MPSAGTQIPWLYKYIYYNKPKSLQKDYQKLDFIKI